MSDPYIVMVTIDFAPADPDSESEARLYEFSGPGEAQAFHAAAESLVDRETESDAMYIGVYDPHPVERYGDSDAALMDLRDWISEAD